MKHHTKALPAGPTPRQAGGLGRIFRGGLATGGASSDSEGSSTPMGRRGFSAVLTFLLLSLGSLIFVFPAAASKGVVNYFGTASGSGSLGGQFKEPRGLAVNNTGNGPANTGDIYVADEENNRVERFTAAGKFISAWGANVTHRNEVQKLSVAASGGTYTLSFKGASTAPLPFNASSEQVDNALGVLPAISGDANVSVSGVFFSNEGTFTITFEGALTGVDVGQLVPGTKALSGSASVTTSENGSGGGGSDYEVCTVAPACGTAAASGGNGTVAGNGALDSPQDVAVDDDTGNVYVSDRDNNRIDEYDGAGAFIASFGFDVQESGVATYEVCGDVGGDVCQVGVGGAEVGQVGSVAFRRGALGLAVSTPDGNAATGTLFLADTQNRRVNTYNLDGTSPSSFGSSATFGSEQPRRLAVDSRGIVYASNSTNHGEIERYDSLNANGDGTVFLAPISSKSNEQQTMTFGGFQEGDTFQLSCPNGTQTAAIDYDPRDFILTPRIQAALDTACGAGNLFVTSVFAQPKRIMEFAGSYAGTNVPTTVCTPSSGTDSCAVTAETNGVAGALLDGGSFAGEATSGLAVDPDSDGAGPDVDALYVLRDPPSGPTVVQQFGPTNVPGLTSPPTAVDDTHGAAARFFSVGGLGLDYASGQLLISATDNIAETGSGHRVYILEDPPPHPFAAMSPITVKTDSTATFSGTVDLKGALVNCKFQYSTDQSAWTDVNAPGCASLDPEGGSQPISQEVTGLDPNTHYFVRLVVSRTFEPGSVVTSSAKSFDTDAVAPVISNVGAVDVFDTSARMVGTIDPRNSDTGYVLQYGTTPALGTSTSPIDIGGGTEAITVSQVIHGLSPDTTYYFRIVATNLTGTTTSESETLLTRGAPPPLPDNRAYEMVTPPDKNLGSADRVTLLVGPEVNASSDGNAVGFCVSDLFGEPAGQMALLCAPYISRRGASGWRTASPLPSFCRNDLDGDGQSLENYAFLSSDYSRAVLLQPESAACSTPPLDPAAPLPGMNLYREDLSANPFTYSLLAPRPSGIASGAEPDGGSTDFSHVVYSSNFNQTDPPDSPPEGEFNKLYDWEEDGHGSCVTAGGCLTLVTKKPNNNEPFETGSNYVAGASNGKVRSNQAVSTDGERIYFQNPTRSGGGMGGCLATCELYMREDDSTTYDVSASECTTSCGSEQPDEYLWSSPQGDRALFESCAKLIDASAPTVSCAPVGGEPGEPADLGAKLYRWDRNGPPGHRLVDLSLDNEPADGSQPNVVGLIGSSEDGNTVYFAANSQLVADKPTATAGAKIYRWRWNGGGPDVDYLGAFAPMGILGAFGDPEDDRQNWGGMQQRVSPDGRYLEISSKARLDPVADQDSDTDVYRWDAQHGWQCASCQLPGVPSAGNATDTETFNGFFSGSFRATLGGGSLKTAMSDDGRVFFDTPDALVPEDVNGEVSCPIENVKRDASHTCQDVYEWNEGTLSLLSSGTSDRPSYLIGTTPSGRDAFFFTGSRLVGWDTDTNTDIYDAHVGGGFPEPPIQPPPCEGEACRAAGTSAATGSGAGTAVFEGPGNPAPKHHKARKHRKHKKHNKQTRQQRAKHNRRAGR